MATVDTIAKIEADVDEGGWQATGAIFNDADRFGFYQRVRLWFDLYLSNGWEAAPRPAFRGHMIPDPWRKLFQTSEAPFSGMLTNEIMKQGEVQGIFYKSVVDAPANRHQIIDMKYAHIIYELISGHCNLMHQLERVNFDSTLWAGAFTSKAFQAGFMRLDLDTSNSSLIDKYDLKQGGFWQRMKEIADIDFYLLYVDKTNRLHFTRHPMFAASLPTAVMTLTSNHLLAPLVIERRNEKVGQIKLQGATPQGLQIRGRYPTHPTAGPIIQKKGYMATSNSLMATIATRMYKYENRDVTVTAQIGGAVGLLLEIMDRIAVTYTSTVDGVAWSSKKFWISKISVSLLSNFNAITTLTLEAEAA